MKKKIWVVLSLCVMTALGQGAILYQDNFDGTSGADLNGLAPDIAPAGVTWNAGGLMKADGTIEYDSVQYGDSAYLPFQVENKHIYKLSVTMDALTGDWLGVGFTNNQFPEDRFLEQGTVFWALSRGSAGQASEDQSFIGIRTGGGDASTTSGADDITIEINAVNPDSWIVTWTFDDGVNTPYVRTETIADPAAYPLNYVSFTNAQCTGLITDFTLTSVSLVAWAPSPANGDVDVPEDVVFEWNTARDVNDDPNALVVSHTLNYIAYDVETAPAEPNFLDPVAVSVSVAHTADPVQSDSINLGSDKVVFWRVDEELSSGRSEIGNVWSFATVRSAPEIDADGQPADVVSYPYTNTDMDPATDLPRYEGDAVFACAFSSINEITSVEWYLAGEPSISLGSVNPTSPSYTNGDVSIDLTDDGGNHFTCTLTIANVEEADQGLYYCSVTSSGADPIASEDASLLVRRLIADYAFEDDLVDGIEGNDGKLIDVEDPNVPVFDTGIVAGTKAILLDGSQYVELPETAYPRTGFANGLNSGTISAWVKINTIAEGDAAMLIGMHNNLTYTACQFWVDGASNINFRLRSQPDVATMVSGSPEASIVGDAGWHMLTATYATGGQMNLYLDGKLLGGPVNVGAGLDFAAWEFPLFIGGNNNRGTGLNFVDGLIDEFNVFNYALDAFEVADLYLASGVDPDAVFCLHAYESAYDYNQNCIVDLGDFAELAGVWLSCGLYPDGACD